MDIDVRIASKGIVASLREWIMKLEEIGRTEAGTPDICDMLVSLQKHWMSWRMLLEQLHKH